MTSENHPLDPIENALVELNAATDCGVFRQTRLEEDRLVGSGATMAVVRFRWSGKRLLALAAVLTLTAGVWTMLFQMEFSSLRRSARLAGAPQLASVGRLVHCLQGPAGTAVGEDCVDQDQDSDGRVTLRDFSVLQLACAHDTTPSPRSSSSQ